MPHTLHVEILTLFPEIFSGFLSSSLVEKAAEKGILHTKLVQIRDFADPPHYNVDDTPYGGGAGMVMKPEPLSRAIAEAKSRLPNARVILFTPAGQQFNQQAAHELSQTGELILICGRYEGIDQRVIELYVDQEISIGDYVLMGGEVPAMVVIEAALRLIENVVGNPESTQTESFADIPGEGLLLEAPQYTRPPVFENLPVPEVLKSGNHASINKWRLEQGRALTAARRPDLLSPNRGTNGR